MNAKKIMYDKAGPLVVKALNARGFDSFYFSSIPEAVEKVISLIPKQDSVGYGGSLTLEQIGLLEKLKASNFSLIDRNAAKNQSEKIALQKKALLADTFVMSANGISQDGVIVNIDANGNRVAAMVYGPDNVIVIAGMNKVSKTVDDAIKRARNIVAPMNAQRFDINTPCKTTGMCADCKSPDTICAYIVITRFCRPAKKIKVILIGEDLGM